MVEEFARPVSRLATPPVGLLSVAATPTPGQGVALDLGGSLPLAVRRLLPGYELAYAQIVTSFVVSDVSEATATSAISPGAVTFDGTAVYAEVYIDAVLTPSTASGFVVVSLFEGSTQITRLATVLTPTATSMQVPVFAKYKFTPSAGSHTYKVTAYASSTTGTPQLVAGAGGTGTAAPAFLRFVKA